MSMEHLVQTISLIYSATEDRLEMRCKSGDSAHSLWISQRLWRRLTPALLKWLVDCGIGTPQSGEFIRQSMLDNVAEPVEVPVHKASEQKLQLELTQHDNTDITSLPETKLVPEPWLCTTANLSMNGQQIRIQLISDRSQHIYILSMSALEAGHFLIAQRNTLKTSGWPFDWPQWLCSETVETASDGIKFLH